MAEYLVILLHCCLHQNPHFGFSFLSTTISISSLSTDKQVKNTSLHFTHPLVYIYVALTQIFIFAVSVFYSSSDLASKLHNCHLFSSGRARPPPPVRKCGGTKIRPLKRSQPEWRYNDHKPPTTHKSKS